MIGYIQMRYSGPTPGIMRRQFGNLNKEVWREDGELWHREMREKRFTYAGARELQFAMRSGEGLRGANIYHRTYTGKKEKKFGHRRPLEYTGESRRLARIEDIRPTRSGVRIVIHARTFNRRNKYSKIDMRDEFTRISDREERRVAEHHDKRLEIRLNAISETETQRV